MLYVIVLDIKREGGTMGNIKECTKCGKEFIYEAPKPLCSKCTEETFLEKLRQDIRKMGKAGNKARFMGIWKVLVEELTVLGRWKRKPGWNARKGYEHGFGKYRQDL